MSAWGQATNLKVHLNKIILLQKLALCLMYFCESRSYTVPFFISSKTLPLNMLYITEVLSVMYDVSPENTPSNISDLFIKANEKHNHETRFSSCGKFYIRTSRRNQNQRSFGRFGAELWNSLSVETHKLPKHGFKKQIK